MTGKPVRRNKLKGRIPLSFEAEGEGLIPILLVAGLGVLVLVLAFLSVNH